MNYYYDIILNWNESKPYEFYEWNDTDYLELVKKIPVFKVKHKVLVDFIANQIKVNDDFLENIKDKTIISAKDGNKRLSYACLFTDGKNTIAFEFADNKEVISRSYLMLEDELNLLEISFSLKESLIYYEIICPLKIDNTLRQLKEAKRILKLEIEQNYQNKEYDKLKYLYYEYKKETEDNIELIYQNLMNELTYHFNQDILKLYYIIKLSYHNV